MPGMQPLQAQHRCTTARPCSCLRPHFHFCTAHHIPCSSCQSVQWLQASSSNTTTSSIHHGAPNECAVALLSLCHTVAKQNMPAHPSDAGYIWLLTSGCHHGLPKSARCDCPTDGPLAHLGRAACCLCRCFCCTTQGSAAQRSAGPAHAQPGWHDWRAIMTCVLLCRC